MLEQVNIQRIGAYAWCLILAVTGGTLIIGALGGSPGEKPATITAEKDTPPPVITAKRDGASYGEGDRMGITQVSKTE